MSDKSAEQTLGRDSSTSLLPRPAAMSECSAMSVKKDRAGARRTPSDEHEKSPTSLPGPNRFPDMNRFGEALAPGTIPDEERKQRERKKPREKSWRRAHRP